MIDWLYTLPEALVMAWASAILICAMVILPRFVQRLPFLAPSDFNTDFVIRVQTTLFTMTSLVLAFTLVQADKDFREADALVQLEASQINNLDRLLTRYNDPIVAAIRRYFDAELDQKIGDLPAELLLDFFAGHVGAYFYNRGLYDAQAAFAARMDDVSDAIYALERKPGDAV